MRMCTFHILTGSVTYLSDSTTIAGVMYSLCAFYNMHAFTMYLLVLTVVFV